MSQPTYIFTDEMVVGTWEERGQTLKMYNQHGRVQFEYPSGRIVQWVMKNRKPVEEELRPARQES
jgi:hypothetical protein